MRIAFCVHFRKFPILCTFSKIPHFVYIFENAPFCVHFQKFSKMPHFVHIFENFRKCPILCTFSKFSQMPHYVYISEFNFWAKTYKKKKQQPPTAILRPFLESTHFFFSCLKFFFSRSLTKRPRAILRPFLGSSSTHFFFLVSKFFFPEV